MPERCLRCGDPFCYTTIKPKPLEVSDVDVLVCRNREIGNLRALLRGAISKLEKVRDSIDEIAEHLS